MTSSDLVPTASDEVRDHSVTTASPRPVLKGRGRGRGQGQTQTSPTSSDCENRLTTPQNSTTTRNLDADPPPREI